MRRYELETEREGSAVYFFIRDIETLDIVLLPTKYLMHKIRSKCSPNTIRRSALSILYYLEYIHEKEQELIDIYQMPYVEQTEHFVKFLYWLISINTPQIIIKSYFLDKIAVFLLLL